MRVVKSVPVEEIACRGSIKSSDVQRLARAFQEDPLIREEEAEALLRLNKACAIQAPGWSEFLVDIVADYALTQMEPDGYVNSAKATWLIDKISTGGWVETRTELNLLFALIGRARWFPLSLATFALSQVTGAVTRGCGPLRALQGAQSRPGMITDGEVALVRDILCAFGADARLPITRQEAEALIGINSAITRTDAPSAWSDLFAKAIANMLLSAEGWAVPSRAIALRSEVELPGARSIDAAVASSLAWLRRDYARQSHEEQALSRLERQRIEIVTEEEFHSPDDARWISARFFTEGGRRSQIEGELVNYLRRECLIADLPWPPARGNGVQAA